MNQHETHFKRAENIAYEALAIAFEKSQNENQELKRKMEFLKADLRKLRDLLNTFDLSPAMKEDNGMDKFKENIS